MPPPAMIPSSATPRNSAAPVAKKANAVEIPPATIAGPTPMAVRLIADSIETLPFRKR